MSENTYRPSQAAIEVVDDLLEHVRAARWSLSRLGGEAELVDVCTEELRRINASVDAHRTMPEGWHMCKRCRQTPTDRDYCVDCNDRRSREFRQQEHDKAVRSRQARIDAGKDVCEASAAAGSRRCAAAPISGTSLCAVHTRDEQVFVAREMGRAYRDMGLGWKDIERLVSNLHPSLLPIVVAHAWPPTASDLLARARWDLAKAAQT